MLEIVSPEQELLGRERVNGKLAVQVLSDFLGVCLLAEPAAAGPLVVDDDELRQGAASVEHKVDPVDLAVKRGGTAGRLQDQPEDGQRRQAGSALAAA